MSEDDYIDAIGEIWNRPAEALALADKAVRDCPASVELWCMRGDLLHLIAIEDDEAGDATQEILRSYEQAVKIDPQYAEAHESIGYYYDEFTDELERAAAAFQEAIRLGAGKTAYLGLAQVLVELGDDQRALAALDQCPGGKDPDVEELRRQIAAGA